jgi:hypothetical protein
MQTKATALNEAFQAAFARNDRAWERALIGALVIAYLDNVVIEADKIAAVFNLNAADRGGIIFG